MLKIRKAQWEDSKNIFLLRTSPEIRALSLDSNDFDFSSHDEWFRKSLNSDFRRIYIIFDDINLFMGVIRFDLDTNHKEGIVSIFLGKDFWGKGIALNALDEAERFIKTEFSSIKKFTALVLTENVASKKFFTKSGYKEKFSTYVKEVQ